MTASSRATRYHRLRVALEHAQNQPVATVLNAQPVSPEVQFCVQGERLGQQVANEVTQPPGSVPLKASGSIFAQSAAVLMSAKGGIGRLQID